jgi:quercetin dioxygenase-like cupin family protein
MAEGVVWERLAATPEHAVNFMKITYASGATSTGGGDLVSHEGYEYGYVLKGTLEIVVGTETFILHEGESIGFDSMIPHRLRNVGSGEFEGIWFVHGRDQRMTAASQRAIKRSARASKPTKRTRRPGRRSGGARPARGDRTATARNRRARRVRAIGAPTSRPA